MKNEILVFKFGTTSVCDINTLEIREDWIRSVAEDVKQLKREGNSVVIFSSGGLATGKKRVKASVGGKELLKNKNILGAIGLSELLFKWQKNFEVIGMLTATLTITENDVDSTSVIDLLKEMLRNDITPIINENIPLQNNFNNDELAAKICTKLKASKFVLFSDTNGIYSTSPKTNPNAVQLGEFNSYDINVNLIDDNGSGLGTGGMEEKLKSALKVKKAGIATYIANGVDFYPVSNLQKKGKYTRVN